MPIDHVSLPVADLAAATEFYLAALEPLGYSVYLKLDVIVGYVAPGHGPDFWLAPVAGAKDKADGVEVKIPQIHLAFKADDKKSM